MRMKGGHRDKNKKKNKTEFLESIEICTKLSWSQQSDKDILLLTEI